MPVKRLRLHSVDCVSPMYRLVRFVGEKELEAASAGIGASERTVDAAYAPDQKVAFADGYPFLLASEVCFDW